MHCSSFAVSRSPFRPSETGVDGCTAPRNLGTNVAVQEEAAVGAAVAETTATAAAAPATAAAAGGEIEEE